ncbi:hypothetical protein H0W26_03415 [Candidatus Dependentiae bacterium]|nr:hypothetical protein [Candidatus Dependentiae bacterium]
MINQGPFDNDGQQFVVSYQLLQLLRWLFEHEQDAVRKVVARALHEGLDEVLARPIRTHESDNDIQQSVIEFFSLLETVLYESLNEDEANKVIARNLIPSIDNIDSESFDDMMVASSVAKATSAAENNPYEDPKVILCKELLKRWKPSKKLSMH